MKTVTAAAARSAIPANSCTPARTCWARQDRRKRASCRGLRGTARGLLSQPLSRNCIYLVPYNTRTGPRTCCALHFCKATPRFADRQIYLFLFYFCASVSDQFLPVLKALAGFFEECVTKQVGTYASAAVSLLTSLWKPKSQLWCSCSSV